MGEKEQAVVGRIAQMEQYYDSIRAALRTDPRMLAEDPDVREMLGALLRYYDGGQWLEDYERDERGELPADLKRGVLSQDGVYDLISEIAALGYSELYGEIMRGSF